MTSDRKPEDRGDELFENFVRAPRAGDSLADIRSKSRTPDDLPPPGDGVPKPGVWCSECRTVLRAHYFVLNDRPLCARCRQPYTTALVHGRGAKAAGRAVLFGSGAALAGIVLMAAVMLTLGFARFLCAIAIGYMVGKAVHAATGGVGGRGYQLLAVVLTYFAIGIGLATPAIAEFVKLSRMMRQSTDSAKVSNSGVPPEKIALVDSAPVVRDSSAASIGDSGIAVTASNAALAPRAGRTSTRGILVLIGGALLALLTLPLIAAFANGLFGVFIGVFSVLALIVGMYKAWQLAEGGPDIKLSGPFRVGTGPIAPTC